MLDFCINRGKMAPIVIYHSSLSPFCRAVLLYARYLDISIEMKEINLIEKEQLSEEFIQINPQHLVPTIDDNGFILWESRAILTYLLESKAPHLVPTSPKEKAIVNQRLHFELDGLTTKFFKIFMPIFNDETTEINQEKVDELYEVLYAIDENYFPNGNEWIASEKISAADFAYVATISTLVELGITLEKYPRIEAWLERCQKTFPDYVEINEKGAQLFAGCIIPKVAKTE